MPVNYRHIHTDIHFAGQMQQQPRESRRASSRSGQNGRCMPVIYIFTVSPKARCSFHQNYNLKNIMQQARQQA